MADLVVRRAARVFGWDLDGPLAIVIRDNGVLLPKPDDVLQPDDEMLFFTGGAVEDQIRAIVHGATKPLSGR